MQTVKKYPGKKCCIEQMQKEEAAGVPQEWEICHLKERTYVVSKVLRTEMEEYLLDVTMLKQNLRDDTELFLRPTMSALLYGEILFGMRKPCSLSGLLPFAFYGWKYPHGIMTHSVRMKKNLLNDGKRSMKYSVKRII